MGIAASARKQVVGSSWGYVTTQASANGAVRSVTVNGHKAKLTVGKASTAFTVTIKEPLGAHTVTVVATDAAGNTASKKVRVKNVR
jgi:hypothetical protein